MRLLLDTHVALWAIAADRRLTKLVRKMIMDPDNEVQVSAASIWEIAIKHGLTRTGMPISGEQALSWFEEAGYIILAVTGAHAAAVGGLRPVHADPFDRIIVAQALTEPSRLLTHDKTVALYSDTIVLV